MGVTVTRDVHVDEVDNPVLVQLLRDKGWIWCYLHHRPESFAQWCEEWPHNMPVRFEYDCITS